MRSVNIFNNQFSDYKTISHDRFGRNKIGKQQKYRDETEKTAGKKLHASSCTLRALSRACSLPLAT